MKLDNITYEGHKSKVNCFCYSKYRRTLISGSDDNTIKEWDAETGQCIKTLEGHKKPISSICYSPDGDKILSSDINGTIKEWDRETGECINTLNLPLALRSVCYSPDGNLILTGCWKTLMEVDRSGKPTKIFGVTATVITACYSSNGERIFIGSDCIIEEWDRADERKIRSYESDNLAPIISLIYTPDGKLFSGSSDKVIHEWDVERGICVRRSQNFPGPLIQGIYPE